MNAFRMLLVSISIVVYSCKNDPPLFEKLPSSHTQIDFQNTITETDALNILVEEYIFYGGGVAITDFNNDGLKDIFLSGNQVQSKLYLNQGGMVFEDVSKSSGINSKSYWATGLAVADVNADGWMDLYVGTSKSGNHDSNLLFINQGVDPKGVPHFRDEAEHFGLATPSNSMGAVFFDYDRDGLLDLYVVNNEQSLTLPTNYRPKLNDGSALSNDQLFRNKGGCFEEVTLSAGIVHEGLGLGVSVADFNGDHWQDIYVTNDFLTNDLLYINNKDGTFSDEISNLMSYQSKFSMGVDANDFNNDTKMDVITLDMLAEDNYRKKTTISKSNYNAYIFDRRWGYDHQFVRNMLQMNNGAGFQFSEIGMLSGIHQTDWSWSPLFVDADNDGLRDLLVTNGYPRDVTDKDFANYRDEVGRYLSKYRLLDSIPIVKIPNYAFKNNGDLTFTNVAEKWGLNAASFSYGAAYADLDNDGDMDYVVNNINDKAFVYQNRSSDQENKGDFLQINLSGLKNNTDAIGTKVLLRLDNGQIIYHEQTLTRGYMSSVDPTVHFGIPKNRSVKVVEVRWPDGKISKINQPQKNQRLSIVYQEDKQESPTPKNWPEEDQWNPPMMVESGDDYNIHYVHEEEDIIDFNIQNLMPHKLSENGPPILVGDFNGDDLEDFMVGSSFGYSPKTAFQKADGTFEMKPVFYDLDHMQSEQTSLSKMDFDNDGDWDIYCVNGGNQFKEGDASYGDQLLVNDGNGNFEVLELNHWVKTNGSVVAISDFDQDGNPNLFVGAVSPFAQYPVPGKNQLIAYDGEQWVNQSAMIPNIEQMGIVTDATWADIDQDGLQDLIVVGEYMPISIYLNKTKSFEKMLVPELDKKLGWWRTLKVFDNDKDGDLDMVVGNLGRNNKYEVSEQRPVSIVYKDFDQNGSIDPIEFSYKKDKVNGKYKPFPTAFWNNLIQQSPVFRKKFNSFKSFSLSDKEAFFSSEEKQDTHEVLANFDRSVFVENLGKGKFKCFELPMAAQIAPINDIEVEDLDKDGFKDLLLIGNDHGNEPFAGIMDAFNGLILLGDGTANFKSLAIRQSGFNVPGNAKQISRLVLKSEKKLFLVTQNRGQLMAFKIYDE